MHKSTDIVYYTVGSFLASIQYVIDVPTRTEIKYSFRPAYVL